MTDASTVLPWAPQYRFGGMVSPPEARPAGDLPTERLNREGRPVGTLRDELRRPHDLRNVGNVLGVIGQSFGVIAAAIWINHPAAWIVAFALMGRSFALYLILAHEAAHRMLFSRKSVNDAVGRWLLGYPAFLPIDIYRRVHMAHHRDEMGPNEPDLNFYANYPVPRASFRRKLTRDLFFVTGWKNLKPLFRALASPGGRTVALRIFAMQLVIFGVLAAAGWWWVYFALWLAPWMTVWKLLNRLRSVAEHGGLTHADDVRATTHHVHQSWLPRFWFVPYNTGWHLAHHVDPGVPFQNLPKLHAELEASGWVTDAYTYANYRSLWRACASG